MIWVALRKRRAVVCARLMAARIIPCERVSVKGTEQRLLQKNAIMKDAPTKSRRGESAIDMEQSAKLVATKDAPILSSEEMSVLGMGQRKLLKKRNEIMVDATTKLTKGECLMMHHYFYH